MRSAARLGLHAPLVHKNRVKAGPGARVAGYAESGQSEGEASCGRRAARDSSRQRSPDTRRLLRQITEAKESKKKVIDIEINFNETFRGDERRGGVGRPSRGRGGGAVGRDGFRDAGRAFAGDDRRKRPPLAPAGGSRKQMAPKVDDINDFPSLGVAA